MINFAEQGLDTSAILSGFNTIIMALIGVVVLLIKRKTSKDENGNKHPCSGQLQEVYNKLDELIILFTGKNSAFKKQLNTAFDDTSNIRQTIDRWMKSGDDQEARLKTLFGNLTTEISVLKQMVEADVECDTQVADVVQKVWEIIKEFKS